MEHHRDAVCRPRTYFPRYWTFNEPSTLEIEIAMVAGQKPEIGSNCRGRFTDEMPTYEDYSLCGHPIDQVI
jgi:hypothetical protein